MSRLCIPNAINVTTPAVCAWVHHQLDELFHGTARPKRLLDNQRAGVEYDSPMILPVSWHPQRSLEQLRSHPYYVTEKYDGVRYFLFLGQYQHKFYSFMIDRRGAIYSVAVSCAADYFQGSLFEGELVFNSTTGKQEYYVFDVIALHGQHAHVIEGGEIFSERMQWIQEIFGGIAYNQYVVNQSTQWKSFVENSFQTKPEWTNKIVSMGNHYSLQFFPKLFYELDSFDPKFMARKDIPNDGYVFTPQYCPIGTVTSPDQPRIWKWKPNLTIDCWLRPSDPLVYLIYKRRREPIRSVRIHGRPVHCVWTERSEQAGSTGDPITLKDGWNIVECLVEFRSDANELVFQPMRVRHDKSFPNSIKTFQLSLPALVAPTSIEDVFGKSVDL